MNEEDYYFGMSPINLNLYEDLKILYDKLPYDSDSKDYVMHIDNVVFTNYKYHKFNQALLLDGNDRVIDGYCLFPTIEGKWKGLTVFEHLLRFKNMERDWVEFRAEQCGRKFNGSISDLF